jgi:cell division protein FtsW (lipid II flippase)
MALERRATVEESSQTLLKRSPESALLAIAGGFLGVNILGLAMSRGQLLFLDLLILVVWAGCAMGGHTLLDRRLPQRDPLVFPLAMFLSGWGVVLINRLTPIFAERQIVWLIVAVAAMLFTALVPHLLRWLRAYRYLLLFGGLGLLVSTIIFGQNPSGDLRAPRLWLGFGEVFFQPSEMLKIVLVAFLASYLAEQYPALRGAGLTEPHRRLAFSPRFLGPIVLMWGLSVVFLVWQRDLGTAVLFFVVFLSLLYVASGDWIILLGGALLIVVAAVAGYYAFSVVELRIDVWLNPWPEADDRAYQIVQSLMAFAAGGPFGQGIGQGLPSFIPVVHSDFVFAAVAEEWGLLGVVATTGAIAVLVTRGLLIAAVQRGRPFQTLLAVGLSTLLATQSLLIMGGVLKLVPLTGVTLPFMSYGGSSLVTNFVIVGLLLRLSASETA